MRRSNQAPTLRGAANHRPAALLLAFLMIFGIFVIQAPTAYADGHIQIGIGDENSIQIKPGTFPDLGDVENMDDVRGTISTNLIDRAKEIAQTVTAICAIVCFVVLLLSITKLSTSEDHSIFRRRALINIMWSGVALSLFGGAWVVVTFFWNFLTPTTPT